ncbi:serine/arginine repetitive matrix protein 1 isoform X2 [Scomber japonicus]|uniref:serine/arginine repetitive matrix protein 1 isoform X2 n=1 Tax=Scomber japonicus TaxID=13676 RepID=UPI00230625E1|nr:serine/arginine repetitive matrix protein 1 isoform X2 [Scomber japonicus]
MAETVRSLFDYRETHSLNSDGEGFKPAPPLRGRGCGRKRKGTPVKVFVTHSEEENVPEHSFNPGDRKEAAENKRPTLDGPFYNTEPAPHSCGLSEQAHDKFSNGSKTSSCSASTPAPAASSASTPTPVPAPAPALATATSAQAPSLTPASTAPAAPTASAPAPTASSFPPSPNCRIREVHCGSQVRLVVIAIRDITKGEEITVDYSLTEWGENLGFRGTVSPAQHECNSDTENNSSIKKEDEPLSLTTQQQRQQHQHQEYVTPSWSLSPSSSPISHSDASDSDAGDEDNASPRGRAPRRRKKRRGTPSKKKTPHRTPPGRPPLVSPVSVPHHNRPLPSPHPSPQSSPPCSPSSSSSAKPLFKTPAPLGPNSTSNVNSNVHRGGVSIDSMRQTCEYCGRHFRSLGRHLDKHHAHQPDVCSALVERYTQMPRLHAQSTNPAAAQTQQQHSKSSQAMIQSRSSELLQSGVQDLSMSPPTLTAANQSPASSGRNSTPPVLTPPRGQNAVPVSVLKRSPPPVAVPPSRKGGVRRLKKERQEEEDEDDEEDVEVVEVKRPKEEEEVEVVCPQSFTSKLAKGIDTPKEEEDEEDEEEEEEEEEENGVMEVEDESGTEDKEKDLLSSGRHHMLPLLSSLSSLVLYLRRLQHSAFLSLSRQLQSAEAWRLLCHSSLALLILYNRRRECEVSKLSIAEYRARITPQCPVPVPPGAPPALTPLEASLSPFERLVLPHLPRVGVQGKRGRIQPLILPPHCEPCLELLLQTRQDVGVDPTNPYVFARPYHSPATPLRGTDLLRSLARSSGTRNPRALTQTRVRRQVAILTQLLLLGEGEEPGQVGGNAVERLEHFLEREYHVTQNCAGIGQDPGLMGRVGRVVLCGERDGVLFRGMSLNHICLELDVMSGNSADSYSEGESDGEQMKEKPETPAPAPVPTPTPTPTLLYVRKGKNNGRVGRPKKLKNTQQPPPPAPPPPLVNRKRGSGQPKSGKRGVLKRPWSEAERAAVEEHLTQNITELRVPAKADCERCLQQCPLLVSNHRDWRAIKFYCHNRIQLLKKNQRRESEPLPLTVC